MRVALWGLFTFGDVLVKTPSGFVFYHFFVVAVVLSRRDVK